MKENNILKPFSAEVLADFNPKLSNLNTWSQNKVKGNYELKKYLKECGILLISPWSLIADSSKKRIIISWREYGEGNLSEKDLEKLYSEEIKLLKIKSRIRLIVTKKVQHLILQP